MRLNEIRLLGNGLTFQDTPITSSYSAATIIMQSVYLKALNYG